MNASLKFLCITVEVNQQSTKSLQSLPISSYMLIRLYAIFLTMQCFAVFLQTINYKQDKEL